MRKLAKKTRQNLIARILLEREVGDQSQIVAAMGEQGVSVTPATISRDLQEMGYVKVRLRPGGYRYERIDPEARQGLWERLHLLFTNFVVDVRHTGNLVLVRTSPGNANGVASLLDTLRQPGVLGTVAGDDTILVVVDTTESGERVAREYQQYLPAD